MMNGCGKSDGSVVPAKSLNNAEGPAAEATEGRELAKGNSPECNALRTQGREGTPSALERVRQAATRDKKQRFTALLHHVYDVERLRAAYLAMKKDAAAGVDGETWEHYGETLEANLQELSHRLKRGAYRARPVRRVYIPKVGKPGELRPLGVPGAGRQDGPACHRRGIERHIRTGLPGIFRTVSGRGAARIKRWMRWRLGSEREK